jgi:hypothetical protein
VNGMITSAFARARSAISSFVGRAGSAGWPATSTVKVTAAIFRSR